jgi:hypothetical protein
LARFVVQIEENGFKTNLKSVEQRTENPCVAGSIPADTTSQKAHFFIEMGFFCAYNGAVITPTIG